MAVVLEKLVCEELSFNALIQWLTSSSNEVVDLLLLYYVIIIVYHKVQF